MNRLFNVILILLSFIVSMPAMAQDYEIIDRQPSGDVTYYDRLSYGWYIYAGGNNLQYGSIPGASKFVWADDNVVYIQDPLTANKSGTFIKARKEGDKVIADFPQVLCEIEDNEGKRPLYIGVMKTLIDEKGLTYVPVESNNHVSWTIHDDGKITMDHKEVPLTSSGKFVDQENFPDSVLGVYYYGIDDISGEYCAIWNAAADWSQTYTPIHQEEITTIPDGLNLETWRMTTRKDTRMVTIAFDGDVVYMGNFTQYVPGAIKGYINGDKICFPTTQYIGFSEKHNANAWFISAIGEYVDYFGNGRLYLSKFIRTDALEFHYDREAKTMTTEPNTCFLVNASATETNHFEYIEDPNLQYLPPEGMNAAPKNPVIVNKGEDQGTDGLLFSVNIPAENVDGVALNTNNMFYNIYLNGEKWEFRGDTYANLETNYTDVPYSFSDKNDFQLRGLQHDIYFHEEGIRSIGVQSCFLGSDGVIYRSDIITTGKQPSTADSDEEDGNLETATDLPSGTTTFTFASDAAKTEPSGTGKEETYDIAISLKNPALAGKAITKIEVPVLPTTKVGNLSVWLAKDLKTKLVNGKNTNIVNKRWNVEMPKNSSGGGLQGAEFKYVSVILDEPYIIPEGGLFVGYSLTVNEIDRSEATQVPIVTALNSKTGGFYLRTSRSYLEWQDRSEQFGVVAMTKVQLAGDFYINAATAGEMPYSYIAQDKEQTVNIPVHNIGQSPIESLQYNSSIGSRRYTGSVTLETPIPSVYAYYENVPFAIPAVSEQGEYDVTIEITGVNGVNNEAQEQTLSSGKARVVKFVPKKRGLVEEFTGTWCGWCPAGFVAMEKMKEIDPEFIGIAYHDRDPMQMKEGIPNIPSGYPEAAFNREFTEHPYSPMGMSGVFSLPQVWDYYCEGFVPVGIDIKAELNGDGIVTATSNVEWVMPADEPNADYRVEYVLVADDLYGNTQGWAQKNYFSTEAKMWDYMEEFWHKDQYITGLHFNDVAIMTSGKKGVSGSITTTETGVANEYTYTFDTSEALNADNDLIPFHKDKLRVIAFILKGDGYGTVVNAAKCDVTLDPSGIQTITDTANRPLPNAPTYNLAGQKVAPNYHGILIRNGKKLLR